MAFKPEDLECIEQAITRGVKTVRFSDRTVEYSSMKDLLDTRDRILAELNSQAIPHRPKVVRLYTSGKGS